MTVLSPEFQSALQRARNPWFDEVTLPDWFTSYRSQQIPAINQIISAFNEVDMVVLEAPVGSGKTVVADTVRQLLKVSSLYVCTTKTLQDQVARDFPYSDILKGRNNYATINHPDRFGSKFGGLSCADCTKVPGSDDSCQWCPSVRECSYERAKAAALRSPLPVINTSYWLSECNGPGRFSGRGLVVLDEGDCLEKELMGWVEIGISEKRVKQYGLRVPKVTVEEDWKRWVDEVTPIIEQQSSEATRNAQIRSNDLATIREAKYLSNLLGKLLLLREGLESGTWLYTGDKTKVSFKPVTVEGLGEKFLWKHGKKFLIMSGTVISSQEMLESLGWNKGYRTVSVKSSFRPENRKVIIRPVADMSKKGQENPDEIRRMLNGVASIVSAHADQSVLIHTVSYDLSKVIVDHLRGINWGRKREILNYASSSERASSLSKFKRVAGSVLVAPSMDRGIDLPDDLCRVQIICKVPFGNLGDKQVAKRLFGGGQKGQVWYTIQAIRTLVQMCGRAVRSEDDWAVTYILDKGFGNLYGQWRGLFPEYFKEGLIWERG